MSITSELSVPLEEVGARDGLQNEKLTLSPQGTVREPL